MSGFVTLLGAGPGDVGLLTLHGKKALMEAEVVVYDALVGDGIMDLIPADAERINVGKRANHHTMKQEQINQVLLEKALEGKNVVRLKGGDPFLFGRGGEELELLAEHGVPFREIPGVTSAISAPAYAGIPVTHRDFASSLHIITGHKREGKELDIDFEALVRTRGTLVFLMGVGALPDICAGLMKGGMDPDTPASIVEKGTTPHQRRLDATVSTLAQRVVEEGIGTPAISVFGKVCSLGEKFDWFDKLALKGKTIVVTRPKNRAGTLSKRLRDLGAQVIEFPCIETRPIVPCEPMAKALNELDQYEWLALTSPAGAQALWDELEREGRDARALAGVKLAVIGPGTGGVMARHGIKADYAPEVYDADHLGAGLAKLAKGRVLILRAEEGTPNLPAELDKGGVAYDDIKTYQTVYQNPHSDELRATLDAGEADVVTFTSASTVKGFVASVGADYDFTKVLGACIGVQTEAEAKKYGIRTLVAEKATMDALIETIRRV